MVLEDFKEYIKPFSKEGKDNTITNLLTMKRSSKKTRVKVLEDLDSQIEELEEMLREIR